MLHMSLDSVIEKIKVETGLAEKEIEKQINKKMSDMDGLVSEEGAAYIVASELGVQLFKDVGPGPLKISKIIAGMKSVEFAGKVTRVFPVHSFTKDELEREVGAFLAGDETGQVRVVVWDPRVDWLKTEKLKEGTIVKIKDGFAKQNNFGGVEVHLSARSSFVLNPPGIDIATVKAALPADGQRASFQAKKIKDILPGEFVSVLATVVHVFTPRFYDLCPTCYKKITKAPEGALCREHGVIEPGVGAILNIVLDDGTETVQATAFRNVAEQIASMSTSEMQLLLENGDAALLEAIQSQILGRNMTISGKVNKNIDYDRVDITISRVDMDPDAKRMAQDMIKQKGDDNA